MPGLICAQPGKRAEQLVRDYLRKNDTCRANLGDLLDIVEFVLRRERA